MKNVKLPIFGLSLVLLIASCKKDDLKQTGAEATTNTELLNDADAAGWQASSQWETVNQENFSVRYFNIEDANITSDVADNGLVLLYKKNGTSINTMPFEEGTATGNDTEKHNANYWYLQVSEGNLLISCDFYTTEAPVTANSFKYFIVTPEKLQSLQQDGHTAEELMNLSYTDAANLLK
jgi:hypothetical protein